ncbi:uncharacterized protein LOC130054736 [Ostrea edulis]|uniref:uncharacterized protein LOC130054736 n=1 Tax=Ostrea edulis TaxID=37623 RepID=UPI0020957C28|nr:uncharacterized protein LOC130054736 [Ostrea edulis]
MRQIKTAENNMAAMDCNVVDAPREKYVRKEEEKIRRRRREKLKRLSNKIKEIMEEEPDIPIMFLYTMNGKTEGQVSPWLRDICHDVAKQMTSASMEHHAEMLLSSKEYRTPTPEEDWRALLSVNAESTPESVLRRLLPLVLRGILKAKCIWKCKKPEGWPDDVNFQDPNRTINNHKISAEELRRVFICLQTSHNIDIEQGNGENPEDASVYLEKENLSTYTIERLLNKVTFEFHNL